METEIGVQSRYDDIRLDLNNTVQRQFLVTYSQRCGAGRQRRPVRAEHAAIASSGITLGEKTGWFSGLRYRYFRPRPLTEDGAFVSPATWLLNGRLGYRFENGWRVQLDGFDLLNSRSDQITYA